MRVFVVSDLHLSGPRDPLYAKLVSFLQQLQQGDVFVAGGDLFELFLGIKPVFSRQYSEFIEAVRGAGGRGAEIHYVEGNHDFLLEKVFSGMPGVRVHPEVARFTAGGRKFVVAHGDLLADGISIRSPLMRFLFRLVPEWLILAVGNQMVLASQSKRAEELRGARQAGVEKLRVKFRNFAAEQIQNGADFVVLGHLHEHDEMKCRVGERNGQYLNLGYPRTNGRIAVWQDDKPSMILIRELD